MSRVTRRDCVPYGTVAAIARALAGGGTAACPDCGGTLYVDDEVERFDPKDPTRTPTFVRAAMCSGCEFTHEF